MSAHKTFFKAITLFFFFNLLLIFVSFAGSTNEATEIEISLEETSEIKNKTVGSWWMWASGSGLIVLLIFAFSKEDEGISFNK